MDTCEEECRRLEIMRTYLYIAILVLAIACTPHNKPTRPTTIQQVDSIYTESDYRIHGDYYHSGHQVYSIDLLSEGLDYDSLGHIVGTGCNLYLSDVFAPKDSTQRLPSGTYEMNSTAKDMHFLHGMYFDGSVTGTYLLMIQENQVQRILLFVGGTITVDYMEDDNVVLDFDLYLADSTHYHATYTGPAIYQ